MEQCGLVDVQKRLIGQLSKGFRQRVGIADSLVHNPDLLILDEPTIGLDPNQIMQVRKLIQELSSSHTLLISSHILSEIEASCSRVLVMNRGQILESATIEELSKKWSPGSDIVVEVKAESAEADLALRSLPELKRIKVVQDGDWSCAELEFSSDDDLREKVFACIQEKGWSIRELHAKHHSLEEAFVSMTTEAINA
jgi:ABC-2 type transport system ATP-binding protein